MKLIILLLLLITSPFISLSQAPQGFNYQAIVRDASGNVRANEGVQFQFRIQDKAGGIIYTENHTVVSIINIGSDLYILSGDTGS